MVETKSDVGNLILDYLRIGADLKESDERLPWFEIREVFFLCLEKNRITKEFPILKQRPRKKEEFAWDYEGRDWFYWLNLFASAYGWRIGEVEELDIDEAIGLMQEIEVERQFEREFHHGLSEIAYPYDKASKKSKFVPLQRPSWMRKIPDTKKLIRRIPKRLIPVGLVHKVAIDENPNPDDS